MFTKFKNYNDDTEKRQFYLEFNEPFFQNPTTFQNPTFFQNPTTFQNPSIKELSISCGHLRAETKVTGSTSTFVFGTSGCKGQKEHMSLKVNISFQGTKMNGVIYCTISAFLKNSTKMLLGSTTLGNSRKNYCIDYDQCENLNRILIDVCETQNEPQTKLSKINYGKSGSTHQLQSYGAGLFKSEKFSDTIINVQGSKFPAHRMILAAMSPVFETMFSGSFKENVMKEVEIENFSWKTVSEMVRYIYTSEMPRSENGVCIRDLYAASDYYDIKELKNQCQHELSSTLNDTNALDVLLLAEMHNDDLLKKNVLAYICTNPSSASDTEKCANIIKKRPELLKDILECKFNQ